MISWHYIRAAQLRVKELYSLTSCSAQVNECMEGVCKIYEEHLKRTNPNIPSITYDISQLFDFIDQVSLPRVV